jgi:hypothetical protein
MNFASYLFSLEDVSADDLRWAKEPWDAHPCCPAFSIRPQELARLGEILDAGTYEDLLGGFSLVAGESQEPPWVVSLPPALVAALRTIAPDDSHSFAARWGLIDEVIENQPVENLVQFLDRMVDFLGYGRDPIVLFIARRTANDTND